MPSELLSKVSRIIIASDRRDIIRWKASANGDFSTKSAWNLVRDQVEPDRVLQYIWSNNFPKKVSFLVWRLLNSWIPMDEITRKKRQGHGVSMSMLLGGRNNKARLSSKFDSRLPLEEIPHDVWP